MDAAFPGRTPRCCNLDYKRAEPCRDPPRGDTPLYVTYGDAHPSLTRRVSSQGWASRFRINLFVAGRFLLVIVQIAFATPGHCILEQILDLAIEAAQFLLRPRFERLVQRGVHAQQECFSLFHRSDLTRAYWKRNPPTLPSLKAMRTMRSSPPSLTVTFHKWT